MKIKTKVYLLLVQKLLENIVHRKTRQICDDLSANTYAQFFMRAYIFKGVFHIYIDTCLLNWSEVKNVKCTEILSSLGQEYILKMGQNFVNHNEVTGYKCFYKHLSYYPSFSILNEFVKRQQSGLNFFRLIEYSLLYFKCFYLRYVYR